jgi:CheY-like chemotaxis protein
MNQSTRPASVLVVDDDPAIRRMMELALLARGFAVHVAASGGEAVDLLCRYGRGVGVVLLDVLMPEMDGPATLRALRALDPDLPACFYTAFPGQYSESELLAAGACTLLTKPCPLDRLTATLRSLLHPTGGEIAS